MDAFGRSAFRGFATARSAEALLRAMGGTMVHVIRPSLMTGTLQQRQLGQAEPQYADVAVGPALVTAERTPPTSMKIDVILPARAVRKYADAEGAENGAAWLASARGILYQGTLLPVTNVETAMMDGVEYVYRVTAEVQ
jgi:hypothetical protein